MGKILKVPSTREAKMKDPPFFLQIFPFSVSIVPLLWFLSVVLHVLILHHFQVPQQHDGASGGGTNSLVFTTGQIGGSSGLDGTQEL